MASSLNREEWSIQRKRKRPRKHVVFLPPWWMEAVPHDILEPEDCPLPLTIPAVETKSSVAGIASQEEDADDDDDIEYEEIEIEEEIVEDDDYLGVGASSRINFWERLSQKQSTERPSSRPRTKTYQEYVEQKDHELEQKLASRRRRSSPSPSRYYATTPLATTEETIPWAGTEEVMGPSGDETNQHLPLPVYEPASATAEGAHHQTERRHSGPASVVSSVASSLSASYIEASEVSDDKTPLTSEEEKNRLQHEIRVMEQEIKEKKNKIKLQSPGEQTYQQDQLQKQQRQEKPQLQQHRPQKKPPPVEQQSSSFVPAWAGVRLRKTSWKKIDEPPLSQTETEQELHAVKQQEPTEHHPTDELQPEPHQNEEKNVLDEDAMSPQSTSRDAENDAANDSEPTQRESDEEAVALAAPASPLVSRYQQEARRKKQEAEEVRRRSELLNQQEQQLAESRRKAEEEMAARKEAMEREKEKARRELEEQEAKLRAEELENARLAAELESKLKAQAEKEAQHRKEAEARAFEEARLRQKAEDDARDAQSKAEEAARLAQEAEAKAKEEARLREIAERRAEEEKKEQQRRTALLEKASNAREEARRNAERAKLKAKEEENRRLEQEAKAKEWADAERRRIEAESKKALEEEVAKLNKERALDTGELAEDALIAEMQRDTTLEKQSLLLEENEEQSLLHLEAETSAPTNTRLLDGDSFASEQKAELVAKADNAVREREAAEQAAREAEVEMATLKAKTEEEARLRAEQQAKEQERLQAAAKEKESLLAKAEEAEKLARRKEAELLARVHAAEQEKIEAEQAAKAAAENEAKLREEAEREAQLRMLAEQKAEEEARRRTEIESSARAVVEDANLLKEYEETRARKQELEHSRHSVKSQLAEEAAKVARRNSYSSSHNLSDESVSWEEESFDESEQAILEAELLAEREALEAELELEISQHSSRHAATELRSDEEPEDSEVQSASWGEEDAAFVEELIKEGSPEEEDKAEETNMEPEPSHEPEDLEDSGEFDGSNQESSTIDQEEEEGSSAIFDQEESNSTINHEESNSTIDQEESSTGVEVFSSNLLDGTESAENDNGSTADDTSIVSSGSSSHEDTVNATEESPLHVAEEAESLSSQQPSDDGSDAKESITETLNLAEKGHQECSTGGDDAPSQNLSDSVETFNEGYESRAGSSSDKTTRDASQSTDEANDSDNEVRSQDADEKSVLSEDEHTGDAMEDDPLVVTEETELSESEGAATDDENLTAARDITESGHESSTGGDYTSPQQQSDSAGEGFSDASESVNGANDSNNEVHSRDVDEKSVLSKDEHTGDVMEEDPLVVAEEAELSDSEGAATYNEDLAAAQDVTESGHESSTGGDDTSLQQLSDSAGEGFSEASESTDGANDSDDEVHSQDVDEKSVLSEDELTSAMKEESESAVTDNGDMSAPQDMTERHESSTGGGYDVSSEHLSDNLNSDESFREKDGASNNDNEVLSLGGDDSSVGSKASSHSPTRKQEEALPVVAESSGSVSSGRHSESDKESVEVQRSPGSQGESFIEDSESTDGANDEENILGEDEQMHDLAGAEEAEVAASQEASVGSEGEDTSTQHLSDSYNSDAESFTEKGTTERNGGRNNESVSQGTVGNEEIKTSDSQVKEYGSDEEDAHFVMIPGLEEDQIDRSHDAKEKCDHEGSMNDVSSSAEEASTIDGSSHVFNGGDDSSSSDDSNSEARSANEVEERALDKLSFMSEDDAENDLGSMTEEAAGLEEPSTTADFDWSAFYNDEGHLYYYNSKTGESSWEPPEEGFNPPDDEEDFTSESSQGNATTDTSSHQETNNIHLTDEQHEQVKQLQEEHDQKHSHDVLDVNAGKIGVPQEIKTSHKENEQAEYVERILGEDSLHKSLNEMDQDSSKQVSIHRVTAEDQLGDEQIDAQQDQAKKKGKKSSKTKKKSVKKDKKSKKSSKGSSELSKSKKSKKSHRDASELSKKKKSKKSSKLSSSKLSKESKKSTRDKTGLSKSKKSTKDSSVLSKRRRSTKDKKDGRRPSKKSTKKTGSKRKSSKKLKSSSKSVETAESVSTNDTPKEVKVVQPELMDKVKGKKSTEKKKKKKSKKKKRKTDESLLKSDGTDTPANLGDSSDGAQPPGSDHDEQVSWESEEEEPVLHHPDELRSLSSDEEGEEEGRQGESEESEEELEESEEELEESEEELEESEEESRGGGGGGEAETQSSGSSSAGSSHAGWESTDTATAKPTTVTAEVEVKKRKRLRIRKLFRKTFLQVLLLRRKKLLAVEAPDTQKLEMAPTTDTGISMLQPSIQEPSLSRSPTKLRSSTKLRSFDESGGNKKQEYTDEEIKEMTAKHTASESMVSALSIGIS